MKRKIYDILKSMTKNEKELIYNLLKTASSFLYGFSSPDFKENPVFSDGEQKSVPKSVMKHGYGESAEKPESENSPKNASYTISPEKPEAEQGTINTTNAENQNIQSVSLENIAEKIRSCRKCVLSETKTNTVPGTGAKNPFVLVIGEAPGEEEDRQGLPFVGPAGKLLDKMLSAISLDRNTNCYIANVVKCRPPRNRDPEKEERNACRSYLDAQIHVLKPKFILALGKVAVRNLFNIDGEFSLYPYRQRLLEYNNIPMVATYHPSALLRNPDYKKPAWDDLKFLRAELEKTCPEYKAEYTNTNQNQK